MNVSVKNIEEISLVQKLQIINMPRLILYY